MAEAQGQGGEGPGPRRKVPGGRAEKATSRALPLALLFAHWGRGGRTKVVHKGGSPGLSRRKGTSKGGAPRKQQSSGKGAGPGAASLHSELFSGACKPSERGGLLQQEGSSTGSQQQKEGSPGGSEVQGQGSSVGAVHSSRGSTLQGEGSSKVPRSEGRWRIRRVVSQPDFLGSFVRGGQRGSSIILPGCGKDPCLGGPTQKNPKAALGGIGAEGTAGAGAGAGAEGQGGSGLAGLAKSGPGGQGKTGPAGPGGSGPSGLVPSSSSESHGTFSSGRSGASLSSLEGAEDGGAAQGRARLSRLWSLGSAQSLPCSHQCLVTDNWEEQDAFLEDSWESRGPPRAECRLGCLSLQVPWDPYAHEHGEVRGAKDFFQHYRLGKVVGEGATGTVRRTVHVRSGLVYACKVVEKRRLVRQSDLVRARTEFLLQRRVAGHPHVVGAQRLFESDRCLYLVMEWCQGGDLFDLVNSAWPFTEQVAAVLFAQIVAGVRACHERGILHRDLKLENILVSEQISLPQHPLWPTKHQLIPKDVPLLKLSDFGSSVALKQGRKIAGWVGGSTMYQAPEVLSGQSHDYSSEVWSLGVILFVLLCGCFPFSAPSDALLVGMVKRGVLCMEGPKWAAVSRGAKELVQGMLQVSPGKRLSLEEVCRSAWVLGGKREVARLHRRAADGPGAGDGGGEEERKK